MNFGALYDPLFRFLVRSGLIHPRPAVFEVQVSDNPCGDQRRVKPQSQKCLKYSGLEIVCCKASGDENAPDDCTVAIREEIRELIELEKELNTHH